MHVRGLEGGGMGQLGWEPCKSGRGQCMPLGWSADLRRCWAEAIGGMAQGMLPACAAWAGTGKAVLRYACSAVDWCRGWMLRRVQGLGAEEGAGAGARGLAWVAMRKMRDQRAVAWTSKFCRK